MSTDTLPKAYSQTSIKHCTLKHIDIIQCLARRSTLTLKHTHRQRMWKRLKPLTFIKTSCFVFFAFLAPSEVGLLTGELTCHTQTKQGRWGAQCIMCESFNMIMFILNSWSTLLYKLNTLLTHRYNKQHLHWVFFMIALTQRSRTHTRNKHTDTITTCVHMYKVHCTKIHTNWMWQLILVNILMSCVTYIHASSS